MIRFVMPENEPKLSLATLALHAGQEPDSATNARAVPILCNHQLRLQ